MPATRGLIVKGHELRSEGTGFYTPGDPHYRSHYPSSLLHEWIPPDRALCSCGVYSDHLPSDRARKRWHRAHKQEVLDARRAESEAIKRAAGL